MRRILAQSRLAVLARRLAVLARRLAADRRGVVAVMTGFAMIVIIGFGGVAIDVAQWLNEQRGIQSAADQGAYSAAAAAGIDTCNPNDPNDPATRHATAIAAAHGYVNGQNDAVVNLTCNPGNATFTVEISQLQPLWFTRLFLETPPTVSGRAVAQLAGFESDLCILANAGTNFYTGVIGNQNGAFSGGGNSQIDVQCGVAVNSSHQSGLYLHGSAGIKATSVYLAGNYTNVGAGSITTTDGILTYQRPVQDPYAGRTFPKPTSCTATGKTVETTGHLPAGVYCGNLNIGQNTGPSIDVTVSGVYFIVGGELKFGSKANVTSTGSGVTFILTGNALGYAGYATVAVAAQAKVSLIAPTTGPYGGLVFFQDRNAPITVSSSCGSGTSGQNQFTGGADQKITGAIYFINQSVCYSGGSSSSGAGRCTQLITHTMNFVGSSKVLAECEGTGISMISTTRPQLIY
jgi:hypothetical protein